MGEQKIKLNKEKLIMEWYFVVIVVAFIIVIVWNILLQRKVSNTCTDKEMVNSLCRGVDAISPSIGDAHRKISANAQITQAILDHLGLQIGESKIRLEKKK